ncbi:YIP1 family protein [bacterium]|nr:YIP1 family protein [bacterium]
METNQVDEQESGVLDRIMGIFTSPRKTFQDINIKPTWAVPLILYVITIIIISVVNIDIIKLDQARILETKDMPQEQLEKIQAMSGSPVMAYIQLIAQVIGIVGITILFAAVLLGMSKMLKGNANFKKIFSIVTWSSLIAIIGAYVKMILIALKGTAYGVTTSLSLFLPMPEIGQKPSFLFSILSQIDPFTIWQLGVLIIGLSVVNNFTTKKSFVIVLSLWVIWIIISLGLAAVIPS